MTTHNFQLTTDHFHGMMQELITGRTRLVESGELTVESEEGVEA